VAEAKEIVKDRGAKEQDEEALNNDASPMDTDILGSSTEAPLTKWTLPT
jgi:hypothetical protein